MKLLAIYDTWHKPIKRVDFGIEYAYLARANHAYTASDETEIPSLDGADCVARITDRLEAAGFRDIWELIEVNAKLLEACKAAVGLLASLWMYNDVGEILTQEQREAYKQVKEMLIEAGRKAEPAP
jgi:hypothetical protein